MDVAQGEMAGRARSKRHSRTGLARVCGDLRMSGGWVSRRRCRQAGRPAGLIVVYQASSFSQKRALSTVPVASSTAISSVNGCARSPSHG